MVWFDYAAKTFMQSVLDALDHHGEAITALFTVVLAISTILLWWATRGLRLDAVETIQATKKTAEAALQANELQKRHLVANYRPWITIQIQPIKFFRGDESLVLTYLCKLNNEGATAATKAGIHSQLALNEYAARTIHTAHSDLIHNAYVGIGSKVTVRAGQTTEIEESVALNVADVMATRSNPGAGFTFVPVLVGTLFYYSAFSDEAFETRFVAKLYKLGDYDARTDTRPQHNIDTEDRELNSLIFERIPWTESFT